MSTLLYVQRHTLAKFYPKYTLLHNTTVGRCSSVGIATHYGLDGPGIESRWGRDFPRPSRPALGVHPLSYKMDTGSFPGVMRPERGVDHPPVSSAEVKQRVELYLYSPSGSSWSVLGWTVPLPFHNNTHNNAVIIGNGSYKHLECFKESSVKII